MPFQNGSSFEYITIDVKIRKYQDNLRIFSNLNQKYHMLLYYYKYRDFINSNHFLEQVLLNIWTINRKYLLRKHLTEFEIQFRFSYDIYSI